MTSDAQAAGFSPDDPNEYSLTSSEMPWVDVPDVSGVPGAFDPGSDPYDAYADAVIAALSQDVQGGVVIQRADFVTHVRAWRANMAAIEKALLARMSVSQAETAAFLNSQIRVTQYVKQFMDASDWFLDSPVPADVRAQVDGVLRDAFADMAEELKDNLAVWEAIHLGPEHSHFFEAVRAFGGVISVVGDGFGAYAEVMKTLVHGSTRIAIGFVPYAGPALDLCEAVTGKRFCLPGGDDLSTEERVFSGAGFGFGQITKAWAGIKAAGVKPGAKIVAAGVLSYTDEFLQALQKSRRMKYKSLNGAMKGAVGSIANEFEGKAGLYLMETEGRAMIGVGDDGVRTVLEIPKMSPPRTILGRAADYLTVTKADKLAVSEVKSGGSIDVEDTLQQLQNTVNKLKEKNLAGDVDRVEIIMKKFDGGFSSPNYGVKDGYLIKTIDGKTKSVEIDGYPFLFVRVIRL